MNAFSHGGRVTDRNIAQMSDFSGRAADRISMYHRLDVLTGADDEVRTFDA